LAIKWKNRTERKKLHFHIDKKWAAMGIGIFIFAIAYIVVQQYGSWYLECTETYKDNVSYWWAGKVRWLIIWMLAVAALPWIYSVLFKTIGREKRFFRTPIEIPITVLVFLLGYIMNYGWGLISMKAGHKDIIEDMCLTLIRNRCNCFFQMNIFLSLFQSGDRLHYPLKISEQGKERVAHSLQWK